jgi:hypothetical protein
MPPTTAMSTEHELRAVRALPNSPLVLLSRRHRCAPPRPGAAPGSALGGPPGARRARTRSRTPDQPAHPARIRRHRHMASSPGRYRTGHAWTDTGASSASDHVALQDRPPASPTPGSRSWTPRTLQPADVLAMLSPRSTASVPPASTGPTPRASTSTNAWPSSWPRNAAGSQLRNHQDQGAGVRGVKHGRELRMAISG